MDKLKGTTLLFLAQQSFDRPNRILDPHPSFLLTAKVLLAKGYGGGNLSNGIDLLRSNFNSVVTVHAKEKSKSVLGRKPISK